MRRGRGRWGGRGGAADEEMRVGCREVGVAEW